MNARERDERDERDAAPAPRRRLGEAERRAALLAAAGDAFREAEYSQVSVARIARAAGASEALAHRYFGSKAGLYAAMAEHALDQLLERQDAGDLALGPEADGWTRLRASLSVYLGFVAEGANGWATLLRSPGSVPASALAVRERGRAAYRDRVNAMLGLDPADLAVRLVVDGYLAYVDAACLIWWEAGLEEELRRPLVEGALAALAAALGRARPGTPLPAPQDSVRAASPAVPRKNKPQNWNQDK
ncbi:TetR/AcrR family transcriptional regulator [Streptomyces sp. NPDC007088]|uniref:TetR/AcrR family transcriptional regulator n=1 Tax=Streptomyces sp. NPDC007088 TaxID=3364773 RepID=UPI00369A32DF